MSDIALGSVQRSIVSHRRDATEARQAATQRLATGRKVSGIADDAVRFLQSKGLTARVQELANVKADIGRGIDTLAATQVGLEAIGKLTDQLKGIAYAAAGNEDQRAELAKQFDVVRRQMDALAGDVSYRGTNLVANPADSLRVSASDKPGTELTVDGKASDVTSLGVGSAATAYNDFADLASIEAAIDAADTARRTVQANASAMGANAAILQVRDAFTENLSNVLQAGADKLVASDLGEEAARAMAANVQEAFAGNSLRMAANSDAAIAGLMSGTA
ncbi:MAG: hypothetical protein H7841_03620 [Magnetospirillum sp. WYHS-4]